MNVGEYIKKLRLDAGYSQEHLGSLLGVQRAAVQKWECGLVQNLKRETIINLANIFNVSPVSFINVPAENDKPDILVKTLTDDEKEIIYLFEAASPQIRAAALAVLKASDTKTTPPKEQNK